MNPNLDKVIDKIKKLLALSKNNPSPEEAASAAGMARELMTRYALTEQMLGHLHGVSPKFTINDVDLEKFGKNKITWKAHLAISIAQSCQCKIYWGRVRHDRYRPMPNDYWVLRATGAEDDRATILYLYQYLRDEIDRLAPIFLSEAKRQARVKTGEKNWTNNFRLGASQIVGERLLKMFQESLKRISADLSGEMEKETGEKNDLAIVLVSNSLAIIEEKNKLVKNFHDKLNLSPTGAAKYIQNKDGYLSGRRAGGEINLTKNSLTDGKKALSK